MLDVVSAVASLLTLIQATSQVVDFLSDLKDGGRERMRLLAEVSCFCCALDNLKDLLENNRSSSEINNKTDEKWMKEVNMILLRDGVLEQCNGVISSLEKRLAPKEGKARVIQHLRWPFSKAEVLQAVEQLHRLQTTINNLLSQINISLSQQIRHDGVISRQILEDQKAQDIRSWLSPLDFAAQQEATFASHCPGTGARFLQSQEYKLWKTSDSSTVWCLGVPGAGKTYLSSIVVHELQQEIELNAEIVLVVYCRYDDPQCQSIANIAGDLLRQCIRNRQMPEALVNLFRDHRSSAGIRPTYDALFSILSEQLGLYRKAYIVVDALDEIAVSDDRKLLLESLRSIRTDLSLMIMSRELEDIKSGIGLTDSVCDCCVYDNCSHCRKCSQSVEYLYQCRKCIHPNVPSPNTFDLCQTCYEAGVRCLGEGHKMEKMPNAISFHVELDEDDLKRYLQWRLTSDSSLKALMAKRVGLQDQVLDAVVRSSGSMSVEIFFASQKASDFKQVPDGKADN
jgi:ankyrin repeat domain-containing protein 50